jgi:hypothetical protein
MAGAMEKLGGAVGAGAGGFGEGMTKRQRQRLRKAAAGQKQAGAEAEEIIGGAEEATLGDIRSAEAVGLGDISGGYEAALAETSAGTEAGDRLLAGSEAQARGDITGAREATLAELGRARTGAREDITGGLGRGRADIAGGLGRGRAALDPYASTGQASTADLYAMATGNWDFQTDPGYAFRREQGEEAIQRAAGAQGSPYSGATLKELMKFNQGLASDEYGRAYARREATLQQLGGRGAEAGGRIAELEAGAGAGLAGMEERAGGGLAETERWAGGEAAGAQERAGERLMETGLETGRERAGLRERASAARAGYQAQRGESLLGARERAAGARTGVRTGTATQKAELRTGAADAEAAAELAAAEMATGSGNALLQGAGQAGGYWMAASDRRLKRDLEPGDEEIEAFLDALDAYEYRYREPAPPGAGGGGRHLGVMAQDAEQSALGDEMVRETPEGKALDIGQGLSLSLAALANVNKRLRALEEAGAPRSPRAQR